MNGHHVKWTFQMQATYLTVFRQVKSEEKRIHGQWHFASDKL